MEDLSVAAQTAMSYLEDVEQATDELDRNDNHLIRETDGLKLINGDLRLARQEIPRADADEQAYLEGLCAFREGMIKWSIASGHSKYYSLGGEHKQKTHRFTADAGESFSKAIAADPKPLYQYYLGIIYKMMERKAEAVQMFELAANGDNPKIAVEARKEMGRIGPVTAPARSASPAASGSSAPMSSADGGGFVRKKQPQWGEIVKGGIALVIGFFLSGILIGIPIALWGIFLIIKGFVQQVDV